MRHPYLPCWGLLAAPGPLKRAVVMAVSLATGALVGTPAAAQTVPAPPAVQAVPEDAAKAARPVLASEHTAATVAGAAATLAASAPAAAAAPALPASSALPPAAAISRTASAAPKAPKADQVAVIEDDGARIEETRRRGQVVRVQVQSKLGNTRGYDIVVKPGAEPAAQQRGAAGRSAWHLFSF